MIGYDRRNLSKKYRGIWTAAQIVGIVPKASEARPSPLPGSVTITIRDHSVGGEQWQHLKREKQEFCDRRCDETITDDAEAGRDGCMGTTRMLRDS